MTAKAARWIFYLGTVSSLALFLGLTIDTHRQIDALTSADRLTDRVVAGKRVWQAYNCNDCHTILGFGSYYGPDMTKVAWRRGASGIRAVVREPEKHTTWRKMPRQAVTDRELDDLVAFLEWTSGIDTQGWPPQDQRLRGEARGGMLLGVSPGAVLYREKGCFECHKLNEVGGDLGPDLTRVGARMPAGTIEMILTDPASVNPAAEMQPPDLTEAERVELTRFLAGLGAEED